MSGDDASRVGYVQFNNAAAAKSALLFDKASFLNETISVQARRATRESSRAGGAQPPSIHAHTATRTLSHTRRRTRLLVHRHTYTHTYFWRAHSTRLVSRPLATAADR